MKFEKRFNPYVWHAPVYTNYEEICRALGKHNIYNKRIERIHPIGMAQELWPNRGFHVLQRELRVQGSPYQDLFCGDYVRKRYPQLEQTMVCCEVTLNEPLVICFEDGSTMELLPREGKGLQIGFDQIPADVQDGANDSNFDADVFLGCFAGKTIERLRLWRDTQERSDVFGYEKKERFSYQFKFCGAWGFTIKEDNGNRYQLEVTNQGCITRQQRNVAARLPFEVFMQSEKPIKQIPLFVGGGNHVGFALVPTLWTPDEWHANWNDGCHKEMITLFEDDAYAYLLYFFSIRCTDDFPIWTWGDWEEHEEDEDDKDYNTVVSYAHMRTILEDIRGAVQLLKTNYDDPALDALKAMFDPCSFDNMYVFEDPRPEDDTVMRENREAVVHFYERFCWLAENMMTNNPQYAFISVWGS